MSCPSHCLFDLVFAFSSHSHCPAQPPKPKRSLCHIFPGDVPGVQLSYSKPQVWDDIPVIKAGLWLPCTLLYALQLQSFKSPDIWVMGSCFFFNPFQVISLCHCAFPELGPDQSLSTECPLQRHLIWCEVNKHWGESWRPENDSFPLILATYKMKESFQHLMLE